MENHKDLVVLSIYDVVMTLHVSMLNMFKCFQTFPKQCSEMREAFDLARDVTHEEFDLAMQAFDEMNGLRGKGRATDSHSANGCITKTSFQSFELVTQK